MKYLIPYILILLLGCKGSNDKTIPAEKEINNIQAMYTGTYTRTEGHVDGKGNGIGYVEFDLNTGIYKSQKTLANVINPSFLAKDRERNNLYAVSELAQDGESEGFIHAFKIINTDSLEVIGKYSTNGRAPCHVQLDRSESIVFVANYLDGTVTLYKRLEDGVLVETQVVKFTGKSINEARQEAPHLHNVQVSADNKKVFVADLGSDKIWIFDLDLENAAIIQGEQRFIDLIPGSGPRHIAIMSDGSFYVINELNSTVTHIKLIGDEYSVVQNITTLPEGYAGGNSCADIKIHPGGKFLYGSNRGHDSLVAYRIDDNGQLTIIGHFSSGGKVPRNFNISPDGKTLVVANQNSDNLLIYNIDQDSGKLDFLSEIKNVMTPVCLVWS